jgi:8-oxo-dGTP pyrophosphatase MutT (NUDIX family)
MTVSAYIVRNDDDAWRCLVHLHKKLDKLMQIGGHIELDETPWQAVAHEVDEEAGYSLDELKVLQPFADTPHGWGNTVHPVPFSANTHNVGDDHYHSDSCYAFIADALPSRSTADNESDDLRWLTIDELNTLAKKGDALQDVAYIYEYLLRHMDHMIPLSASDFSLEKPRNMGVVYKRGKPSENR